jgi:hypothetical protein
MELAEKMSEDPRIVRIDVTDEIFFNDSKRKEKNISSIQKSLPSPLCTAGGVFSAEADLIFAREYIFDFSTLFLIALSWEEFRVLTAHSTFIPSAVKQMFRVSTELRDKRSSYLVTDFFD